MTGWNGRERRRDASLRESVAALTVQVAALTDRLDKFVTTADQRYVTKDRYRPVERIVYGLVAVALTALLTALVYLVAGGPP